MTGTPPNVSIFNNDVPYLTPTTGNSAYLKLDQTTPQSVINGVPYIVNGIKTPKIYPNADSSTAFQINKADGTTNVLNVDTTNGRVGIGTTNPVSRLDVSTLGISDGLLGQRWSYNTSDANYYLDLKQTVFSGVVAWNFSQKNNGTAYNNVLVLDRGNVGIGTTNPAQKLEIQGLEGSPAVSGTTQNGIVRINNSTHAQTLDIGNYGTSPYGSWIQSTNKTTLGTYYPLVLQPNGSFVGIGLSNPQYPLDVYGDIHAEGSLVNTYYGSDIVLYGVGSRIYNQDKSAGWNMQLGATGDFDFWNLDSGNWTRPVTFQHATGYVGLGTTAPGSRLTVSGHIGSLGTIPTLTGAGTGSSITTGSTDTAGEITEGTSATGAVITFANAYTNIPFAIVVSEAGLLFSYTVSTTAITITNIGALSSTKLSYHVIARE